MRRARALARRYGHALRRYGHASVGEALTGVRKVAHENPMLSSGLLGAVGGMVVSDMSLGSAAVIGAVTGIAAEKIINK